jgi:nucleoid DNA-binding protein
MAAGKRMTKAQTMSELAEKTGLTKKEIAGVFDALQDLVKKELGRRGPGEFVIPDMIKLKVRKIPAKPARIAKGCVQKDSSNASQEAQGPRPLSH